MSSLKHDRSRKRPRNWVAKELDEERTGKFRHRVELLKTEAYQPRKKIRTTNYIEFIEEENDER